MASEKAAAKFQLEKETKHIQETRSGLSFCSFMHLCMYTLYYILSEFCYMGTLI